MDKHIQSPISLKKIFRSYLLVIISVLGIALLFMLLTNISGSLDTQHLAIIFLENLLQEEFLIYLLVGFTAQMIDGALGMAYGISSTSFLISAGVSPAIASASVHISEVITSGISGISHWKIGNVDQKLFKKLVIPGAIGAAIGAYLLSSFDGEAIKPYVSVYLLIMGIVIIIKSLKKVMAFKSYRRIHWLALLGGFIDASGGGGWGPVVTTTLVSSGNHPRLTIGTVNAAEFFVALTTSGIFILFVGINSWPIVAGLMVGGAIAAPLGAYVCHKINIRIAMILVGLVIIFLSLRTLLLASNLL